MLEAGHSPQAVGSEKGQSPSSQEQYTLIIRTVFTAPCKIVKAGLRFRYSRKAFNQFSEPTKQAGNSNHLKAKSLRRAEATDVPEGLEDVTSMTQEWGENQHSEVKRTFVEIMSITEMNTVVMPYPCSKTPPPQRAPKMADSTEPYPYVPMIEFNL